MQVITRDQLYHRTKLMDAARAERFARCLAGNSRFETVSVEESKTAKSERKFYVRYQPTSDTRYRDLLADQAGTRERRAAEQAGKYLFVLEPEGRWFYCWNQESGDVYETTERTCDCPDHHYRGAAVGPCKHIRMLRTGAAPVQSWEG